MRTHYFIYSILVAAVVLACEKSDLEEPVKEAAILHNNPQLSEGGNEEYGQLSGLLPDADIVFANSLYYDDVDEAYYVYFFLDAGFKTVGTGPALSIDNGELTVIVNLEDDENVSCSSTNYVKLTEAYLEANEIDLDGNLQLAANLSVGGGNPLTIDLLPAANKGYKSSRSNRG